MANPLDRVALSQRDKFNLNKDGSIDLCIQNESPGKDPETNWLPSPKGVFMLFMRLYWPIEKAPSILDGSWKPPAVKRVRQAEVVERVDEANGLLTEQIWSARLNTLPWLISFSLDDGWWATLSRIFNLTSRPREE